MADQDIEFYEVDAISALEDLIRYRVKMEVALRRIESITSGGSDTMSEEITKIAHEGLQPPKGE